MIYIYRDDMHIYFKPKHKASLLEYLPEISVAARCFKTAAGAVLMAASKRKWSPGAEFGKSWDDRGHVWLEMLIIVNVNGLV